MKRLAAAVLAVILSCVFTGGSIILAEDSGYVAAKSTEKAAMQPAYTIAQATPPTGSQPEAQATSQEQSQTAPQPTAPTLPQPQTAVAFLQPKPISVQYSRNGVYEIIRINAEGYTDYGSMELKTPLRLVIDLKNTKAPVDQTCVKAGGAYVKLVRYAEHTRDTSRVVLELNEGYEYSAEPGKNGITVYVTKKRAQETLDRAQAISFGGTDYCIGLDTAASRDVVRISLKSLKGRRISRLTGPDRLVLTIPDAGVFGSDMKSNVNSRQIGAFSYKKTGSGGAVITINLRGQFQYEFGESDGQLVLTFHWPNYTSVYYNSNNDRVYFTLSDTRLTEGAKDLKLLYTDDYDKAGNRYTITFPTSQSAVREGKLDINDAYLKAFEVKLDPEAGTTSLIFTGNGKNAYLAFTRESGLTAITVMKPEAEGRELVVIDAGHGGYAAGTTYGTAEEKNLNLDMAKRLDTLLTSRGIRTYMLRSDDSNLDNYERVYIANKLAASLYLSIHVNAMDDRSYSGTMTLYCPSYSSGFTGKSFADIIQKNLLAALKTRNREVVSRPDLIVLRETSMPSALAEVAFLSNKYDRANLLKPSFRQKAAQALCDSIVQSLPKLG